MQRKNCTTILSAFLFLSTFIVTTACCAQNLQEQLNEYFVDLDAAFAKVAQSGALRSTSLRSAERLFVREMRRNQAYTVFLRTNSKGVVISEVIRGEKVERPMRSIANQRWFRTVSTKKEAYYTLIKDSDRGRYYLLWTRPVLKRGDRFVGAVGVKIDLWDSFYEFSNTRYVPFLIKLGRKSLFSHKWKKTPGSMEQPLAIQGIKDISVIYLPEKEPESQEIVTDTAAGAPPAVAIADTVATTPQPEKKQGKSGLFIFLIVLLVAGVVIVSLMLISWNRRRMVLKRIDDDDDLL